MDHSSAREHILKRLKEELPEHRTYHSLEHTLDVYAAAISIGEKENVGEEEMDLLKTAALYHDAGFVIMIENHEQNSCFMAREDLPRFGFNEEQIERICSMIMATKVPQGPTDQLSEILCDADLDYLGRNDFDRIGQLLFQEFLVDGIVTNEQEWDILQVNFLKQHAYFTDTNRAEKAPMKADNLSRVIERVNSRK
jgi:predicted metal-dependent HD superfamily phosphohydrolase